MLGYLWWTRYLSLVIEIDKAGNIWIHIDRAHAVYSNSKEYLGLHLVIGYGAMINILKKLGLVTTSFTETEIVSIGERFPKYM